MCTPEPRPIQIDPSKLAGPVARAVWINPRDGSSRESTPPEPDATPRYQPPGEGDWALWLES